MEPAAHGRDVYDSRTIAFHWFSAALVAALWILGQSIGFLPKGLPRLNARSVHIALGVMLAVLLAARVAWRVRGGVKLAPSDSGINAKMAIGIHYLLYALLFGVVFLGMTCVWVRGDMLYDIVSVPTYEPDDEQTADEMLGLHGLTANALLCLAGIHSIAAVLHHRVLKDGVLRRMWPGLSQDQFDEQG